MIAFSTKSLSNKLHDRAIQDKLTQNPDYFAELSGYQYTDQNIRFVVKKNTQAKMYFTIPAQNTAMQDNLSETELAKVNTVATGGTTVTTTTLSSVSTTFGSFSTLGSELILI